MALALRATALSLWPRFGLAVGFAAVAAIGWELAEYFAFIRFSSELATAYTDTLGDLALGTLGGALGAEPGRARAPGPRAAPRRRRRPRQVALTWSSQRWAGS